MIHTYGNYWNGVDEVQFYADQQLTGTPPGPLLLAHRMNTAANFPQDSNLRLIFAIQNGVGSAAKSAEIEFMQAAMLKS